MKQTLLGLAGAGALLLAIASCSNEDFSNTALYSRQVTVNAKDFKVETDTRTDFVVDEGGARFYWAEDDVIGIFPDEGSQAYFAITDGAGYNSATFTGGGFALKPNSHYAAYYPFISDFELDRSTISVTYNGQKQIGNGTTTHLSNYDYMAAAADTPNEEAVCFDFEHLGCLLQMQLTLPAGQVSAITLAAESDVFASEGYIDLMASQPGITATAFDASLTMELEDITAVDGSPVTLYMMLPPTSALGQTLTVTVTYADGTTYSFEQAGKNFIEGRAYQIINSPIQGGGGMTLVVDTVYIPEVDMLDCETLSEHNSLKIIGELNGTDIASIRCWASSERDTLDLSEAHIVESGEPYYKSYTTTNDVIGDYIFSNCYITKIILPNDVTTIGKHAFEGCWMLGYHH